MGLDDRTLQRCRMCSGPRGARCRLQQQLDEAVFKFGCKYDNFAHDLAGKVMEVLCQHDFGQHRVDSLQAYVGVDYQCGVVAARVAGAAGQFEQGGSQRAALGLGVIDQGQDSLGGLSGLGCDVLEPAARVGQTLAAAASRPIVRAIRAVGA